MGLRGPERRSDNPDQKFLVHTDVPEVWEENILQSGGKHYGHLEVDILPADSDIWQATLKPVYIFRYCDLLIRPYSDFVERRMYDDQIILNPYIILIFSCTK